MPPWATGDAVQVAARVLRDSAAHAQPLAVGIGQHSVVAAVRSGGRLARQAGRLYADAGVDLVAPYFDDRVVEAALSVRLEERSTPWRYKPLLVEAMRGIVPDSILCRTTKGEFSTDLRAGLRRHRADLLDFFDSSLLAARGLIDLDQLRVSLTGPHPDNHALIAFDATLACESWLQVVQSEVR